MHMNSATRCSRYHRTKLCLASGGTDTGCLQENCRVRENARPGPWTYSYTGEGIASGLITANMEGIDDGWLRIQMGELDQWLMLAPQPRYFGGCQWYFVCQVTSRYCSVV